MPDPTPYPANVVHFDKILREELERDNWGHTYDPTLTQAIARALERYEGPHERLGGAHEVLLRVINVLAQQRNLSEREVPSGRRHRDDVIEAVETALGIRG